MNPAPYFAAIILTVVNHAGIPRARVVHAERAVERQLVTVRKYWHIPPVRFGFGGWTVTLVHEGMPPDCTGGVGCHLVWSSTDGTWGNPFAYVGTDAAITGEPWTVIFDHEVIETLVDPRNNRFDAAGQPVEIVDPTMDMTYSQVGESGKVTKADHCVSRTPPTIVVLVNRWRQMKWQLMSTSRTRWMKCSTCNER